MVCTAVTTMCGMWLAYGEPPNLIMKANLDPYLGGIFFLRYCGSVAIVAYLVVARHLRGRLAGSASTSTTWTSRRQRRDVRFLQATRHGEVLTPVELVEAHSRRG